MPVESKYPKLDIPNVDIWGFLFERKDREYPDDKVLLLDPETNRSYTYAQVKNTAIDFGKGLKNQWDWQKDDVVALYTPNCIDTPAVIWGVFWAGGIVSPANPGYTVDELAFQLKDAGAKALVTQMAFLDTAKAAAKKVGIPGDRIIVMGDERDSQHLVKHFVNIRATSGASRYRRTKVDPHNDLAFLVYSSGTTGHPKGVMLTHENIVSNVLMLTTTEGPPLSWKGGHNGEGDKILAFLPFFHIYGLTCLIHTSIYAGTTLVVMVKFDLERWCSIVQSKKITFSYVVPPVVLGLAKSPVCSKYDLSSIRMLSSGAAPLSKEIQDALYKRLKMPCKQGYGLSETSPGTHTQTWEEWNKATGSVGKLLPNQVVKYVNEEEKEIPRGETGELWVKGPNIFKGYLNNEKGTKNALTDDGYFKTGDIGYEDSEGNFYITDRAKELIKYKGFQVPPAELEGLLASHPLIDDAAVIGIYNKDQATEVPRAYIVLKEPSQAGQKMEKEITDWIAKKVAAHKRLRGGIRFIDVVPKSVSGKILRRILKDQAKKEEEEGQMKAKL